MKMAGAHQRVTKLAGVAMHVVDIDEAATRVLRQPRSRY
jgi:hypothetical protein